MCIERKCLFLTFTPHPSTENVTVRFLTNEKFSEDLLFARKGLILVLFFLFIGLISSEVSLDTVAQIIRNNNVVELEKLLKLF
jgi:hypothetical protein